MGNIKPTFHKRGERFAFTVKKVEIDNPEKTQKDNALADFIEVCKDKLFHIFQYRCEIGMKFEHAGFTDGSRRQQVVNLFISRFLTISNCFHHHSIDCLEKLLNTRKIVTNSKKY